MTIITSNVVSFSEDTEQMGRFVFETSDDFPTFGNWMSIGGIGNRVTVPFHLTRLERKEGCDKEGTERARAILEIILYREVEHILDTEKVTINCVPPHIVGIKYSTYEFRGIQYAYLDDENVAIVSTLCVPRPISVSPDRMIVA